VAEPEPPEQPTPGAGSGGSPGSDRERALIEGALKQASPRPGGELFAKVSKPLHKDAIPGYEIVREVHRGGQGVVYQAIQKSTQRKVAIKVIHGGALAGERERARLEREVRILAGLDHPGIVKVHDSGVIEDPRGTLGGGGAQYFVMDYVSGHSLDAIINAEPKPVDQVLRLFAEICEAVSAAHLRGVIHRDLKPSNIRVDASGRPHVLDFGLAKLSVSDRASGDGSAAARAMTMTGQFVGSLPWASPEQASGLPDKVDVRTDVYSLGVMLYQMLTGRFPYAVAGQMRDVLDNILRAEPARPSTVRRQVNDEVETIVLKCLAKDPARRYQSAGELARDIGRYLRGEPVEAKRDSGWYVISKHLRRHRAAVGVALGGLVLLAVFAVVMSWMYARELDLKREVERQLSATQAQERATQAALSQARANFEATRRMARAFQEGVADGLEDLRGATPVRARVVEAARAALAALAEEAERRGGQGAGSAADPDLLRDLAEAHDRLGDLEAGLYLPRKGTTAQGAARYAAARTIRESLLAANPAEPLNMLAMAQSLRRSGDLTLATGKPVEAIADYDRAAGLIESALAGLPPARMGAAREALQEARADGAWARVQAADAARDADRAPTLIAEAASSYGQIEQYWRERLRADAGEATAARRLGRVTDQRARAHITLGRALASAAADATKAGRTEEASRLSQRAEAALLEAVRLSDLAALDFERLHAVRPQSGALRREQMLAIYNAGDAQMRLGDAAASAQPAGAGAGGQAAEHYHAALAKFKAALTLSEELVAADASNLSARRELALVLNKLGNTQRDLSRVGLADRSDAMSTFERSLAVRQDLFATDPTEQHRRDLAVAHFKLGELEKLGADAAEGPARWEALSRARLHYTRSREAFEALATAGVAVRESELARVNRDLADIQEALRSRP